MEMRMTEDEVEKIILEWAEKQFPGVFDTCVISTYSSPLVKLSKSEPKE